MHEIIIIQKMVKKKNTINITTKGWKNKQKNTKKENIEEIHITICLWKINIKTKRIRKNVLQHKKNYIIKNLLFAMYSVKNKEINFNV